MDGQQTEGFADNIARQTFAGNIHQSDMSSASTALEGMIYFLMEACSAGNADDDLLSNGATNVHPSIRTRVENISLSNEAIRSTLGCAPQLPAAQECKF